MSSPSHGWSHRKSRQERGYGAAHDAMRKQVLAEEPLCRECLKRKRVTPTTTADHIVPLAESGTGERSNYQGLCDDCHTAKTAEEAARARGHRLPRRIARIGPDGWPEGS